MEKYILVLYYTCYGNTKKMADMLARGINSEPNITAKLRTVPNVSPTTEQTENNIPEDGAPYVTLEELSNCSGLALGSPTRFGNMAAAMKYFWDQTSKLWLAGELIDKPATVFTSTGSLHGGQEATLLSMMLPLMHHGMIIVGLPNSDLLMQTTSGGTPYGSSHLAGRQGNPLTQHEQELCFIQGKRIAQIAMALTKIN